MSAGWIPAAPLLAPVVDAGGTVVIYERSGVPPFILCGPLGVTASTGKSEIPEYLTVDRPLRTLMLADPGQGRRILQKHSLSAIVPADLMLYETVFMQSDDTLSRLQEIIHSASFELVLVASPGLIANGPVAQTLLNECRCAGIGVVVVHSEDLSGPPPKWLGAAADVGWELWKLPGEAAGFVFKRPGDFDATTLRRTDPGWVASSSTAREKDMAGIPPVQITPGVISS